MKKSRKGKRRIKTLPSAQREPVKSYAEKVDALAAVGTFDPQVFVGDATCPAHICNFVLALAVMHNDLNDIGLAFELRHTQGPFNDRELTRERGLAGGIGVHLIKLRTAIIHELLAVVAASSKSISHPWFCKLVEGMAIGNKRHWQSIVTTAEGRSEESELGRFLATARHKVAAHYDAKMIGNAFRKLFVAGAEPPCLSKGIHAAATRFYFADATVAAVMFARSPGSNVGTELANGSFKLITSIDHALNSVITRFIKLRNGNPVLLTAKSGEERGGIATTSDDF